MGGTCQARSAGNFFVVPSTFLALQVQSVLLVSASLWSLQFDHFLVFCSSYSRCLHAQSFVKVWARAPVPWMESVSLSCYSFTPESIIKKAIQSECIASQGLFPIFAFKITHRVILSTRFCKLLTRIATPSGGHVPQWHDASGRISL